MGTSSSEERRNPYLPPSRPEERRTPHLPRSRPEEWTKNPPGTSSSDPPPGHQLPSAILRSGSPDRSSTLKIGSKIEIGLLLRFFVLVNPCYARHIREFKKRILKDFYHPLGGLYIYIYILFPEILCMKRVYRDNASVHWSAARNKERFSSR